MKGLRSILILFLTFLFILCIAQASAFSITSNITTNTVCPSSTIVIEDVVTASSAGAFTITIEGTAATFTTTVPTGFWLEGGQSQSVYSYITPSSQVVPGNYKLKITVEKSDGHFKTVEHNIIVENCHNTVLSVEPETLQICACEENTLMLHINNKGNYLENYLLSVEGPAANWINLSSDSVTLASCTETDVEAYVMTPCNVAGNYEVNFVVEADNPYSKTNAKANIEVVFCYDYTISSEKTYYSMCEAEELNIPIKIKNFGTRDNVYRINLEGPSWTVLDQKTLNVAKGEEKTLNLIAKPPYATEGNFTAHVEVLSDYGDVLKKYDINLNVEKCYDVRVIIEAESDRMCNALSNTYSVTVKNNGKFENTFDISLEGPEWATISEKRVTLGAGEEQDFILDIHPPYNTLGMEYEFTITARDSLSGAESKDTITIEAITIEDCYKPAISTADDPVTVARDSTATAIFIVENKGEQLAHYNIEISGTGTSFSQINPGAIDVEAGEAQTIYLYIAPPPETQLQDYKVTVTVRLEDTTILASRTITINVVETEEGEAIMPEEPEEPVEEVEEESWLQKFINWIANLFSPKEVEEETEGNVQVEIEEPEEEPAEEGQFSGSEGDSFIFNIKGEEHTAEIQEVENESIKIQISSEPFVVDLKIGETGQYDTDGNGYLDLEITLNAIVDGVADLTFKELEEEIEEPIEEPTENRAPELIEEIPDMEIGVGQTYKIDLADYFEDPDGDVLTYVTVKPLNVDISIAGSIVSLTPKTGTEGETRDVTFYASDGVDLTQSNTAKITITESEEEQVEEPEEEPAEEQVEEEQTEEAEEQVKEKASVIDFFSKYSGLIIAGLIILVIIIIILSGLGKKIIGFFEEEVPVVNNRKK